MKSAIITGGTGFLGRHTVQRLVSEGYHVYALVRADSRHINLLPKHENVIPVFCPVEQIMQVKDRLPAGCKAFFHFAWSGVNREELDDSFIQKKNVEDSVKVLRTAIDVGAECFLFAGSRSEYGKQNGYYKEDNPCHPMVQYGKAKLEFGRLARELCEGTGMTYVHPRIFSVYGPDDHPWSLIYSSVRKMLDGEAIDLSQCTQLWNFMDVDDAADLFLTMTEMHGNIPKGDSGIFNAATKDVRPLKKFVEEIRFITESKSRLNYGAYQQSAESAVSLLPDMTKVETVFGWKQKVIFADGIRKVIRKMEEAHA